jgi:transposase
MTSSVPHGVCYDWARTFSLHPRHRRRRLCLTAEPVVIDYETFCKIHDCHDRLGLTIVQTARALGLHPQTIATWVARAHFEPRRSRPRKSVLDPFKPRITRLLDTHPYSAQQIFQRLREEGYGGGATILRDCVRRIRPTKRPVYLKLQFAPGECAQVDWGSYGTVAVGNTQRRLSFFVMVLAFSRQMFVEFTVSQTMEHFLAAHEHAFAAFGGVPAKIMVDNLKSAVLQRLAGTAPVFNPRYLDFARHHGFAIAPCNVARGNEKGRVESGVGYVKKNFLHGLTVTDLATIQAAAQVWLDTIANVRIHGETQQRPVDLLAQEQPHLRPLNPNPYDLALTSTSVASSQFRITLDTNHYSVPAAYAHRRLTVKAYPDRLCIYFDNQLIARHTRSLGRHEDIEDPDHPKELLAQRGRAREQRLMMQFLALSPDAAAYYEGLEQRRFNARHHVRKILAKKSRPLPRSIPSMLSPARSPTASPSRPSAPSTSPTSWRPGLARCRNPAPYSSPVETICSISTSRPQTSPSTRGNDHDPD